MNPHDPLEALPLFVPPVDAPAGRAELAARLGRLRRLRRLGAGALVTAAAVLAAVVLPDLRREEAVSVRTDGPPVDQLPTGPAVPVPVPTTAPPVPVSPAPGPTGAAPAASGPSRLDPGPLSVRGDAAVVWTGREVVVWGGDVEAFNMGLAGGDRALRDGAAYDPMTGRWRMLASSPLPASSVTARATWTGEQVVVVRGGSAASWDPVTDTWTSLPSPGVDLGDDRGVGELVWTGQEVLAPDIGRRWAFGDDRWKEMADRSVALERPSATWTGDRLVQVGLAGGVRMLSYDPGADGWDELSPPPDVSGLASDVAWDGREVVAIDSQLRAAAYDPSATSWRVLPDVPVQEWEGFPSIVVAGGRTVAFMPSAIAILEGEAWRTLPYGDVGYGTPVAAGGTVFSFGFNSETDANAFGALRVVESAEDR